MDLELGVGIVRIVFLAKVSNRLVTSTKDCTLALALADEVFSQFNMYELKVKENLWA